MTPPASVVIRECGPRDGLQGETPLEPRRRAELAAALAQTGLPEVEAVAFVSPRAVPAMAGADEVARMLDRSGATVWWALVPNLKGAELAVAAGFDHLTVTVSASPAYSEKNVGRTVAEALGDAEAIRTAASGCAVDVVVSCAFGSPYGDGVTSQTVGALVARLQAAGVDRVTLADTTGVATPRRIDLVLDRTGADVGLHLHDTRAIALANAWHAYGRGVRRFDTAVGGLGGSPFAAGAGGNLATEDLVAFLADQGVATGVDLDALLAANRLVASLIGRPPPSRVGAAGPLPPFD